MLKPFNASKADAYIRNLKKLSASPNHHAKGVAPLRPTQKSNWPLYGTKVDRQLEDAINGKAPHLLKNQTVTMDTVEEDDDDDEEDEVHQRGAPAGEIAYYQDSD